MCSIGIIQFLPSMNLASHIIKEYRQDVNKPNPKRKIINYYSKKSLCSLPVEVPIPIANCA